MRSWSVDVPSQVGGYIEIQADSPNVGDKLRMRLKVNGRVVDEQSEKLDQPLQAGTAFFLQDHFQDYSKALVVALLVRLRPLFFSGPRTILSPVRGNPPGLSRKGGEHVHGS